ncbi:MAG: hypothetical protein QXM08_03600 [Thermofilaceae archaeon]
MTVIEIRCTTVLRDGKYVLGNYEKIVITRDTVIIYYSNGKRIELPLGKNDYVVVRNPELYCTEEIEDEEEQGEEVQATGEKLPNGW